MSNFNIVAGFAISVAIIGAIWTVHDAYKGYEDYKQVNEAPKIRLGTAYREETPNPYEYAETHDPKNLTGDLPNMNDQFLTIGEVNGIMIAIDQDSGKFDEKTFMSDFYIINVFPDGFHDTEGKSAVALFQHVVVDCSRSLLRYKTATELGPDGVVDYQEEIPGEAITWHKTSPLFVKGKPTALKVILDKVCPVGLST